MEQRITNLEKKQDSLETTFKMYMQRMDHQFARMEERFEEQKQRDAEFRAQMQADMRELRARQDRLDDKREMDRKDMYALVDKLEQKMDTKFDNLSKHVQTLTITSVVGIVSIAAAVIIFVFTK